MQSSPRRIVIAIADALFEIESRDGREERLRSLADEVFELVSAASFVSRLTLFAALFVLRLSPLLLFMSWRPLDWLDRERRLEAIARIERSPFGLALVAWRTLLVLHFYEDARELAAIGYRTERKRHLAVVPVPATSGVRLREDIDLHDEVDEADEKGAA